MAQPGTGLWCRYCGQAVRLEGAGGSPEAMRKAVHAATGEERGGPDGHLASPIDHEPVLWKAARVLAEEFGGVFSISARFGFLRADWANIGTPVHYEADTEEEMRGRLREAVAEAGLEAADEAAVP